MRNNPAPGCTEGILKMGLKNIFFDFDGVVAESVTAKTEAFREMYLPHGESIADKVVDYHIKHGGVSRFEKFKYWEKHFFDRDLNPKELDAMALHFSDLVMQKVIDSKEVTGVREFLEKYHRKMNCWIITGTPTNEIEIIAKKKNLVHYFRGIHGSPKTKIYWTEFLIEKYNLARNETIFLGDATTDKNAAEHSGLLFALRDNAENKELFKEYQGIRFESFYELEDTLIDHKYL